MVKWIKDGWVWGEGVRLAWMAGSIGDKGLRMLIRLLIVVQWIGDGWVWGVRVAWVKKKHARLLKLENI